MTIYGNPGARAKIPKGMGRKLEALNVLLEVPGFFSYTTSATDQVRLLILL